MAQNNNVRLIEDAYAAFAKGDIQYILDRVTEDVDWINEGPESIPYAGTFKGPEQVQQFFQGLGSTLEGGRVTPTEWIAEGDKVVSIGRFSATVKETGKRIDVPVAHLFTVRDGKIARWVGFADTARVAEAYAGAGMAAARM
ncbi:MAG TPA: nuclear transport factor 2 family protein [Bryobacteraceae bacterium]|jgi:ketosteroid isomerase-like protein|nr:nuclear transport factor 2 family protein [Bryobacteraceae bacterium]